VGKLILTYHVTRLDALSREGSDLLGLRADIGWLLGHGVPLHSLDALLDPACERGVAITFDDGTRIDAESIEHPRLGRLPSALSILGEFQRQLPDWHASTFIIASPDARGALAAGLASDYGPDLMHERWWLQAERSGLLRLENHSWDHNHPLVTRSLQRDNLRGSFHTIGTEAEAEGEIAQASDYIERAVGRRPRYFAYPFGEASHFLREDYLPRRGPQLGLSAAFSTEPRGLRSDDDRWFLPRFVSGRDWCSDDGLRELIAQWVWRA
jgi:peptidoglycan/xylan/chitin deacetylase (PgdA/CDA1 family)